MKNEILRTLFHGDLNVQNTGGQIYILQAGDCRILLWENTAHGEKRKKKNPIDITALLEK